MLTERIFNVYWEGPRDTDNLDDVDENAVLYMICGTHGLYGRNVPLYIGMTTQVLAHRIGQHSWVEWEPDPVKIYWGYAAPFKSWSSNYAMEEYPRLSHEIIEEIEALLIFAHQPVYNARSKISAATKSGHIRIFNSHRRSTLYPEVSSLCWDDGKKDEGLEL